MQTIYICLIFIYLSHNLVALKSTFSYDLKCPISQLPAGCVCKLSNKQITSQSDNLHSLVSLSCKELSGIEEFKNLIKSVNYQFGSKYALSDLKIVGSSLTNIPWEYMTEMNLLENFSVSNNSITTLQPRFKSLGNQNINFNQTITISTFNVSYNLISNLDSDVFDHFKLVVLDLSNNYIESLPQELFSSQSTLESLSLASNNIKHLNPFVFKPLSKLKYLDLSNNHLEILSAQLFWSLPSLTSVSIASNKLQLLENNTFINNALLDTLEVGGNPWVCNLSLIWINSISKNAKQYLNSKPVNCTSPSESTNKTLATALSILELEKDVKKCPTCNICDCTVIEFKLKVQVDCQNRSLEELPRQLPRDTKVVLLQNNNIKNLTFNFEVWKEVLFLKLDGNEIDSLKGFEESGLHQHLVTLSLAQNKFSDILVHLLEQMTNLLEIYLGDNPWKCDCNTVNFQRWLQEHHKQVRDIDNLYCVGYDQPIFKLLKSDLCPQPTKWFNILDVVNGIIIALILLIIFKLVLDAWRQKKTGKLPRFWSFRLG